MRKEIEAQQSLLGDRPGLTLRLSDSTSPSLSINQCSPKDWETLALTTVWGMPKGTLTGDKKSVLNSAILTKAFLCLESCGVVESVQALINPWGLDSFQSIWNSKNSGWKIKSIFAFRVKGWYKLLGLKWGGLFSFLLLLPHCAKWLLEAPDITS